MLAAENRNLAEILRPPRRMRVSEAAAEGLTIEEGVPWDATRVPYMVRPMDETASRKHDVVCFVGPARTGKTMALVLGRYVYTVACHPMDFMVVHSSKELARDLSGREIKRLHRYSAVMSRHRTGRSQDDNTFDKQYRSGIRVNFGWPSNTQLASRTIPVMLLTDYGRWPDDIGGEGSGFQQARKRTETGGSLAMTVVESSPSGHWVDPEWQWPKPVLGKPLSHAPPPTTTGTRADIMPIYGDGTREWWYVPCEACGEYYPQNADIGRFSWRDHADPVIAAQDAGTVCCWCGAVHGEETKRAENANGIWLAEGEIIDCNGKVSGESRKGLTYPSFWLGGGSAAYQTRQSIVLKYLQALAKRETSGDEEDLQFVVNADIGSPYRTKATGKRRSAHPLMERAEHWPKRQVPPGVRFLVAAIDVQKSRFVVQVIGYGPQRERWVIDRYNLKRSKREAENGEALVVNPAAYAEDWMLLDDAHGGSYPLADESGRRMAIMLTACDSGGAAGVTDRAYDYWRALKPKGFGHRLRLVKGANSQDAKQIEERWPDTSGRGDIKGGSRGDVPILYLNTGRFKDTISADLERAESGPGYIHFPDWLGPWFFEELAREEKGPKGWEGKSGNEAWDLLVYADAAAIWGPVKWLKARPDGILAVDWENPPRWAEVWDKNSLVFHPDEAPPPVQSTSLSAVPLEKFT